MGTGHNKTIYEAVLGYKEGLDRTDRLKIDFVKHQSLIFNDQFTNDVIKIAEELGIKKQNKSKDIKGKTLILSDFYWEVNSKYVLGLTQKEQEKIERYIHKKILVKYKISFNFYPLVEYILLYRDIPFGQYLFIVEPNPRMFELYTQKYPLEYVRNYHTTSDIKFFIQKLKFNLGIYSKPTKLQSETIDFFKSLISINKNKERVKDLSQFNDDFYRVSSEYSTLSMKEVSDSQLLSRENNDDWASEKEIKKNEQRLRSIRKRFKDKGII